jgi:hypothetical protein
MLSFFNPQTFKTPDLKAQLSKIKQLFTEISYYTLPVIIFTSNIIGIHTVHTYTRKYIKFIDILVEKGDSHAAKIDITLRSLASLMKATLGLTSYVIQYQVSRTNIDPSNDVLMKINQHFLSKMELLTPLFDAFKKEVAQYINNLLFLETTYLATLEDIFKPRTEGFLSDFILNQLKLQGLDKYNFNTNILNRHADILEEMEKDLAATRGVKRKKLG